MSRKRETFFRMNWIRLCIGFWSRKIVRYCEGIYELFKWKELFYTEQHVLVIDGMTIFAFCSFTLRSVINGFAKIVCVKCLAELVGRLCWFLLIFFDDAWEFCVDFNEPCSDIIRSFRTGVKLLSNFRSTCLFIDADNGIDIIFFSVLFCSELQNRWHSIKENTKYTLFIPLITWDIFNN